MNQEQATHVVAYLNAGFPRDTLEPESFAIWVGEVMELPSATAALDAAKVCVRQGDRFPTLKEFRTAYRQAFDRHMAGRELEAAVDAVPPPAEFADVFRRARSEGLVRSIDDLPEVSVRPPEVSVRRWCSIHGHMLDDDRFCILCLRTIPELPVTDKVVARPVWERHERRDTLRELLPPSAAEIHDAILVLRDHHPDDESYVGVALHMEAFRILDEVGA